MPIFGGQVGSIPCAIGLIALCTAAPLGSVGAQRPNARSVVMATPTMSSVAIASQRQDSVPPNRAGKGALYGLLAAGVGGLALAATCFRNSELSVNVIGLWAGLSVALAIIAVPIGALIGSFYPP